MNFNRTIKDITMIILGNISMAFAYSKWMVPNKIINGGITSLSQIINGYSNLTIPTINTILMIILLSAALIFLGKEAFIKSILSSTTYSIFFTVFFNINLSMTINPIVDLVIASFFISFGYYACISANGSTVGVDVIALIIHKKKNNLNISMIIKLLNCLILVIGFLSFGVVATLLGILFSQIYTVELNWMLNELPKIKIFKAK